MCGVGWPRRSEYSAVRESSSSLGRRQGSAVKIQITLIQLVVRIQLTREIGQIIL